MSNKLDSVSSEELLKALENTETTLEVDHPIFTFVKKLDLKPGNFKVPTTILWKVFKKLNPGGLKKSEFLRELGFFLEVKHAAVYLDRDTISLYTEILKIKVKSKKNPLSNDARKKHFEAFLKNTGVGSGQHKIPAIVLYHIYRCYCVDNKKSQFSQSIFFQYVGFYIQRAKGRGCTFYLVNQETANKFLEKEFDGIKEIYFKSSKKEKNTKKSV